jgi:hypothetical protein
VTGVQTGPPRELVDGPPARLPFLAHLPTKVHCRITATIYCHGNYVAMIRRDDHGLLHCGHTSRRRDRVQPPPGAAAGRAIKRPGRNEQAGRAMTSDEDFSDLDDSALLNRRAQMRAELERLPSTSPDHAALTALYDLSTEEVNARATKAWTRAGRTIP